MFSDNLAITISLDKETGKVNGLMTLLSMPDDIDVKERIMLFFSHAALIAAYGGENAMKTIGGKYIKLTTNALETFNASDDNSQGVKKSFTLNGKKYGIFISSNLGIVGYAELK